MAMPLLAAIPSALATAPSWHGPSALKLAGRRAPPLPPPVVGTPLRTGLPCTVENNAQTASRRARAEIWWLSASLPHMHAHARKLMRALTHRRN
eukprot:356443-Chlamydomonas_euryale.AAC.6